MGNWPWALFWGGAKFAPPPTLGPWALPLGGPKVPHYYSHIYIYTYIYVYISYTQFFKTGIPATLWVHYTTSCNTQSSAPEDARDQRPKHVELIGIINKPLLLHLVGVYIIYINPKVCILSAQSPVTAVSVTVPHRNNTTCPWVSIASCYCERSNKWRTVETEKYGNKDSLYWQNLYTFSASLALWDKGYLNHAVKVEAVLVIRGYYTDLCTFLSNLLRATNSAILRVSKLCLQKYHPLSLTLHHYIPQPPPDLRRLVLRRLSPKRNMLGQAHKLICLMPKQSSFCWTAICKLCILIVMVMYLLTCKLCGILLLPSLRFSRAFSSVVRQMPGYTSQRRGTARTLPN